MAKILVAGGAGYIGSHTMVNLMANGFEPVCVDNHVNSYSQAIRAVEKMTGTKIPAFDNDLCNPEEVARVFDMHPDLAGVIHFAALKAVGESVDRPVLYFRNNLNSLINVCDEMLKRGLNNFIFSSSCTVYGQAKDLPVTEETPFAEAESPYGRTKQIGEGILADLSRHAGLKVISLRYFNPAGAHHSGAIGEAPRVKALNLVPVITETANGKRSHCTVFGDNYPTRDGTCVRDYIHVTDLAEAHVKALDYLLSGKNEADFEVFNLGIGEGVTVLEAIRSFERVSGQKLNFKIGDRRPGDVIATYSNFKKASRLLGWQPQYSIDDIMETAWKWELNRKF